MTRASAILIVAALAAWCTAAPAQDEGVNEPGAEMPPESAGPTTDLQSLLEGVAAGSDKKFLVDGLVPQTIHIGGTDVRNPTYPVLLSILRNNGLAAVEIGGYVNIMRDAAIRQLPLRIVQRDDPDIADDEWVTRVITVRNGNAAQLVPILRPLLSQPGHLAATGNEPDQKLLIVAWYGKVKQITELVQLLTE